MGLHDLLADNSLVRVKAFTWVGARQPLTYGLDCSGVVYKNRWIITAHHCFESLATARARPVTVPPAPCTANQFGAKVQTSTEVLESYKVCLHPVTDIAVIELAKGFKKNTNITLFGGDVRDFTAPPPVTIPVTPAASALNCYGFGHVGTPAMKFFSANASWGKMPLAFNINPSNFTGGKIGINPLDAKTETTAQRLGRLRDTTCEGATSLLGITCSWTNSKAEFDCTDPSYFEANGDCKNQANPFSVYGDSGGPCFDSRYDTDQEGNKMLVSINSTTYGNYLAASASITQAQAMVGADWPWLSRAIGPLNPALTAIPPVTTKSTFNPKSVYYLMDLDGDLKKDYVIVSNNAVNYALNYGNSFSPVSTFSVPIDITNPDFSFSVDFNYDGKDDLVEFGKDSITINTTIFDQLGDLSFSSKKVLLPHTVKQVVGWDQAAAFFLPSQNSAYLDLVRVDANDIYYLPWSASSGTYDGASAVDSIINKNCDPDDGCSYDRVIDFVALDAKKNPQRIDFVSFSPGLIMIKNGNGAGGFGPLVTKNISRDCSAFAFRSMVDLNGDGMADYLCVDQLEVKSWMAHETGDFDLLPSVTSFEVSRDWPTAVSIEDFDLDGHVDIAVAFATNSFSGVPKRPDDPTSPVGYPAKISHGGQAFYKLGSGDGTFGPAKFFEIPSAIMEDAYGTTDSGGHRKFWASLAQVDIESPFDLFVVGRTKAWLQSAIFPTKLQKARTRPASIEPWRQRIWSRQLQGRVQ